jgi:hypothetical protein
MKITCTDNRLPYRFVRRATLYLLSTPSLSSYGKQKHALAMQRLTFTITLKMNIFTVQ